MGSRIHHLCLQLPSRALTDLSALSGSVNELLIQQQKSRKRRGKAHGMVRGAVEARQGKSSIKAASELGNPQRKFGHGVGTVKARTLIT